MIAYGALAYAGLQLGRDPIDMPYFIGGAALLLVFIGIHNAWDTVAYITMERARELKARAVARKAAERTQVSGGEGQEHRGSDAAPR